MSSPPSSPVAVPCFNEMDYDDVAWERSDSIDEAWKAKVMTTDNLWEIGHFLAKHSESRAEVLQTPCCGSYNACVRMDFEDDTSTMIRFPCPGSSPFAEEKTRAEVAVLRYLKLYTDIPVPAIVRHGTRDESPCGLGPFVIMEYIKHSRNLGDVLNSPGRGLDVHAVLDPNVSGHVLEHVYEQVAGYMLQLARPVFRRIGSLREVDEDSWEAAVRPITWNMNDVVQLANFPPYRLPPKPSMTASSFYLSLAEMHIDHLDTQHNDAVVDADDCRRKYVGRLLFRKLAIEHRLGRAGAALGPFGLFCDDMRPANMLVDDGHNIRGVIDWEWTYTAPEEFTVCPPWWLLLERPESCREGYDAWAQRYEPRLNTFLAAMAKKEQEMVGRGALQEPEKLSARMRQSWESGDFWMVYAARKSWAFDSIFWKFLDQKYFGSIAPTWEEKLELLSDEERDSIEPFVAKKMAEREERGLIEWETSATQIPSMS